MCLEKDITPPDYNVIPWNDHRCKDEQGHDSFLFHKAYKNTRAHGNRTRHHAYEGPHDRNLTYYDEKDCGALKDGAGLSKGACMKKGVSKPLLPGRIFF